MSMARRRWFRKGAARAGEAQRSTPHPVAGPTTAATTEAPFTPTATEGGGVPDAAAPHTIWHTLTRWFADNTFVPERLPARWRHPAISYILAIALEVVAAFVTLGIVRALPTF